MHVDHRKACKRLAEFQRVVFDHRKMCRRLAEVPFAHPAKRVGGLQKFVATVLTTAKRVRGL